MDMTCSLPSILLTPSRIEAGTTSGKILATLENLPIGRLVCGVPFLLELLSRSLSRISPNWGRSGIDGLVQLGEPSSEALPTVSLICLKSSFRRWSTFCCSCESRRLLGKLSSPVRLLQLALTRRCACPAALSRREGRRSGCKKVGGESSLMRSAALRPCVGACPALSPRDAFVFVLPSNCSIITFPNPLIAHWK